MGPVRPDGFHEIASLMVPITLSDRVVVERTPGAGLDVVCDVAPGADNLAAKAIRELGERLDRSFEVRVTIEKRVPSGGGLGGGSSDAAAALLAVERLFSLDLSTRVLYDVAVAVGSDVPFFLWPGPQLAMGRGQVLKDVALPALHLVVAIPDIGLSTAAVYRWRDEDAEVTLKDFAPRARLLASKAQAAETARDVAALVANDLEPSVVARKQKVGELLERLRASGALAAAMTGSGAAVFGALRHGGEGPGGAGGRGPGPRLVRHRPAAGRAQAGAGQGARQTACVIHYPAASRRAAGRLAAPLPTVAGA